MKQQAPNVQSTTNAHFLRWDHKVLSHRRWPRIDWDRAVREESECGGSAVHGIHQLPVCAATDACHNLILTVLLARYFLCLTNQQPQPKNYRRTIFIKTKAHLSSISFLEYAWFWNHQFIWSSNVSHRVDMIVQCTLDPPHLYNRQFMTKHSSQWSCC